MKLKGNNAEKIATIIIMLIILLISYILINLAFRSITHTSVENMIKDGLGFSASCIAPIIAILLFNDWREQHNKQVRNEFALKVFNQFEILSKEVSVAELSLLDLESFIPEGYKGSKNLFNFNVLLDKSLLKDTQELIYEFENKIIIIQREFVLLLDKLKYFGIVINQSEETAKLQEIFINKYSKIHNDSDSDYKDYLELIDVCKKHLNSYSNLLKEFEVNFISDVLAQLQET